VTSGTAGAAGSAIEGAASWGGFCETELSVTVAATWIM
jgi:hypothetical protein